MNALRAMHEVFCTPLFRPVLPIEPLVISGDMGGADVVLDVGISKVELQNALLACLQQLSVAGASTHRVENVGEQLARSLGMLDTQVYVLPTLLSLTFDGASSTQPTRTISVKLSPGLSIYKMEMVDSLLDSLLRHPASSPGLALKSIADFSKTIHSLFPMWLQLLAGAVTCGGSAVLFFNTPWNGAAVAFVIALAIISPITYLASLRSNFALLVPSVVAVISGFLTRTATHFKLIPHECAGAVSLACIINLAPGVSLAIAALELASGSIVSGTARLIAALAVAFLIGIGINMGTELAQLFDPYVAPVPPVSCAPISLWWLFLTLPVVAIAYFVLLDLPLRRWLIGILAVAMTFFASFGLAYTPLSSAVQTTLIATLVGLCGVLYSRYTVLPSSTLVFAGILVLLPGSLSIRTLAGVLSGSSGFGLAFLEISISIAVGLLLANVPRFRPRDGSNAVGTYLQSPLI